MSSLFRQATVLLAAMTGLLGVAYPLATTFVATATQGEKAGGSLVSRDGVVVGSSLVGQAFSGPGWFHGRPSAAAYDGTQSNAANRGPLHPELRAEVAKRAAELRAESPEQASPIPIDLVTTSASGLDPHLSPAAARWQVPRVARERGLPEGVVGELVERHVEPPLAGFLGSPRVNVLLLNLALDNRAPRRP